MQKLKRIVLPESLEVTGTGEKAGDGNVCSGPFCDSGLEEVIVPRAMTEIKMGTFWGCRQLRAVVFEEGSQLRRICQNAFNGCRRLKSIALPQRLEVIGSDDRDRDGNLYEGAFEDSGLEEVTITKSVKEIKARAFCGCRQLGSVVFQEGAKLENISLTSLQKAGLELFATPEAIGEISQGKACRCERHTKIVLEEGTEIIEEGCFKGSELEEVTIPRTVREIKKDTFRYCEQLRTITFEEGSQLS